MAFPQISRERKLQGQRDKLLRALKRVYRKHWLDDESIGWEELGTEIQECLCGVMGDDWFVQWLERRKAE
jgi:hypothetical protein